jgi:hypothetical protein
MNLTLRGVDLRRLNSLTKYPSIPTYHMMGERGMLGADYIHFDRAVLATEKVDGTNARIVFLPDRGYLIGSREEFLYARGDLLANPAMGIAAALRPVAERLAPLVPREETVLVYFGEVYGGKITGSSRQYASLPSQVGFRLFDVLEVREPSLLLEKSAEEIAGWREAPHSCFLDETALLAAASAADMPVTPRVAMIDSADLPNDHASGLALLTKLMPLSQCRLDDAAPGRPEGLVVRTPDRRQIAKIRYEDYERAARRR